MNHTTKPFTDKELLEMRQAGRLPRIDIAGDDFVVVWDRQELQLESDPRIKLSLGSLPLSEDGKNYLCFYNLKKRALVYILEDITRLPENIVLLQIPIENFLDPVGVARQYGQPDTFMLDTYPLRMNLKAKVIPIESSGLPELIRVNIEKKKARSFLRFFRRKQSKSKRIK